MMSDTEFPRRTIAAILQGNPRPNVVNLAHIQQLAADFPRSPGSETIPFLTLFDSERLQSQADIETPARRALKPSI